LATRLHHAGRRIISRSIRSAVAALAVGLALSAAPDTQAQSEPKPAAQPARKGARIVATQQQLDEATGLVTAYLGHWLAEDPARYAFEPFVTDDAVFEYPYGDEAFRRIEGRPAIAQALRTFPAAASNWTFSEVKMFRTLRTDVFYVEYKARAYVPSTGHTYESTYLSRITVRDGKIAAYYELWEPDARAAAFGTAERH
jgi:ketosteroid isomerase-like protein